MDMHLTESMKAVQEICENIKKKVDRAYIAECGRTKRRPEKLWRLWADTGLLSIGLSQEYGGGGGSLSDVVLAHDLLHQAGLVMGATVTSFMARASLIKHGTEEQKQRILPGTASGEIIISASITEADAGSNLFKLRTSARPTANGEFVLNGQKTYQTGFVEATYALVVCRTSPLDPANRSAGLSLLLVDTKSKGISATPMDIAMHSPDKHYTVNFDDVVIPRENLVGAEGGAIHVLFDWLNPERLLSSAMSVGMADHVLGRAAEYAKTRSPFKAPIGSYQAVQHPMAIAKAHNEAARGMLYSAAAKFDAGLDTGVETSMVKYLSSEAFLQASNIAMTTFGGASLDLGQDILPFYLLAKLLEVAPVNNNIVLSFIAERSLGLPKSYA